MRVTIAEIATTQAIAATVVATITAILVFRFLDSLLITTAIKGFLN